MDKEPKQRKGETAVDFGMSWAEWRHSNHVKVTCDPNWDARGAAFLNSRPIKDGRGGR